MSVEALVPEIIRQVRKEAKELKSREERARDLWSRTRNLLEEKTRASKLRSPGGISGALGRGKPIPVLGETFGEEKESVEVEISPRNRYSPVYEYESGLDNATFRIEVGRRVFWLPPQGVVRDGKYSLPESETLDLLEELMTAIEERRGVESGGLTY